MTDEANETNFQTADLMVRYFQHVLRVNGQVEDALRLEGPEVDSPDIARTTIHILSRMQVPHGRNVHRIMESKELTLRRLHAALEAA